MLNEAKVQRSKHLPAIPLDEDTPQIMKPAATRLGTAIGFWIFAAIVCSVSFFLTFFVIKMFVDIVPTIFVLIADLVGVGIAAYAFKCTLQIFNPVVTLVASSSRVRAGEEIEFSWIVQGDATKIDRLAISVVGEETVRYRQGTSTRTETQKFADISVVTTTDKTLIKEGFQIVNFPKNTMHTFSSPNNILAWKVKVHGSIPRWPDIEDEFTFAILPPKTVA